MTDKITKATTHATAAIMGGMIGMAYGVQAKVPDVVYQQLPPVIIREAVEHVNPSEMSMKAAVQRHEKLPVQAPPGPKGLVIDSKGLTRDHLLEEFRTLPRARFSK